MSSRELSAPSDKISTDLYHEAENKSLILSSVDTMFVMTIQLSNYIEIGKSLLVDRYFSFKLEAKLNNWVSFSEPDEWSECS